MKAEITFRPWVKKLPLVEHIRTDYENGTTVSVSAYSGWLFFEFDGKTVVVLLDELTDAAKKVPAP